MSLSESLIRLGSNEKYRTSEDAKGRGSEIFAKAFTGRGLFSKKRTYKEAIEIIRSTGLAETRQEAEQFMSEMIDGEPLYSRSNHTAWSMMELTNSQGEKRYMLGICSK